MSAVSSFSSLSRDNLVQFLRRSDFFTRNPALQPHEETIRACLADYDNSSAAKKSGCGCGGGGNTKLLIPCLEGLLKSLEELKVSSPEAVANFVHYATGFPVGNKSINVSIYYTRDNGAAAHRYEFIA